MMICAERTRLKQEFDLAVVAALVSNGKLAQAGFPNHQFAHFTGSADDANRKGEAARAAYLSHIESDRCNAVELVNSEKVSAA